MARNKKASIKIFLTLLVFLIAVPKSNILAHQKETKNKRTESVPIYFIILDGISHKMINELRQEGHFKQFGEPSLIISTFPSDTNIALTGIFQYLDPRKAPGYESKFYDRKKNKIIGGRAHDYKMIEFPFRDQFDFFHGKIIERSLIYAFPSIAAKKDFDAIQEEILTKPRDDYYFSIINSLDGVNHIGGKENAREICTYISKGLDTLIEKYQKLHGQIPHIVIFSDHGFYYQRLNVYGIGDFSDPLEKAGFRLTDELKSPNDIIIVDYGNVGAGVAFIKHPIQDSTILEQAALAMLQLKGVDIIFYRISDKKIGVFAMRDGGIENAFLFFKPDGNKYGYQILNGDPLKLRPIIRNIVKVFGPSPNNFYTKEIWFEATWNHVYPDPIFRTFKAFSGLVENYADIIFSLKPNYSFSGPGARAGCVVCGGTEGTHGAILFDSSNAFVMSNDVLDILPPVLRYDQLLRHFIPKTKAVSENLVFRKQTLSSDL